MPSSILMKSLCTPFLAICSILTVIAGPVSETSAGKSGTGGDNFTDAAAYGFSPGASGIDNTKALQTAVDQGGTIIVSQPGVYRVAGTVYLSSNTSLNFGNGVFIKKVWDQGPFSHVFLNKGALTKTYNEHISIDGLQVIVNGVDVRTFRDVYGLHGQLAFFYVKDLRITRFRCLDLGNAQYCIHVCTFEDLLIDDVIIMGQKDGVHLGKGKGFTIRNCTFSTGDDSVALNAHDWEIGNPELGWIENGLVENCHDLAHPEKKAGYFCRFLAGAWVDWYPGMKVQRSDTVVSNGRLYRVEAQPDGKIYTSITQPTHLKGAVVLDNITWGETQDDGAHTAGVRNVTVRDCFLENPRTAFCIFFDNDRYSRSFYPGAQVPKQEGILLDDIRVLYDQRTEFLHIGTPVDSVTVMNSSLRNSFINFPGNCALTDFGKTILNFIGCTFEHAGKMELLVNTAPQKTIVLKTSASAVLTDDFSAFVTPGNAKITIDSDLPGLQDKNTASPLASHPK